jgi:predicted RNase H-like nuclease (RuvC/YqgF family)
MLQVILSKYVWIQGSFLQDGELKSELSRENKELSLKKQDKQNEIESLEAKQNKLEREMTIKHKIMNLICAKARTEFVSKKIKKDFKAGLKVNDLRMG